MLFYIIITVSFLSSLSAISSIISMQYFSNMNTSNTYSISKYLSCPSTYVYNLDKLTKYKNDTGYGNIISENLHMYNIEQHNLGEIIFSNIFRSKCIVQDPEKATVFLVPVLSPKENIQIHEEDNGGGSKITTVPKSTKEVLQKMCPSLSRIDLKYKYKGPHVLISDRFFSLHGFCRGYGKVDISTFFSSSFIWASNTVGNHQLSIAYPSTVNVNHENTPPPWILHTHRKYLMTFGASPEGTPRNKKIRAAIANQCKNSKECNYINLGQYAQAQIPVSFRAKFQSTFCIEPGGYGPERKSMMDSLLLGCIPVIVSDDFVRFGIWKVNWWWYKNASIIITENDILDNNMSIRDHLAKVSPLQIRNMRDTIAKNAHTVHWGKFYSSAFETFLRAISNFHLNKKKVHV